MRTSSEMFEPTGFMLGTGEQLLGNGGIERWRGAAVLKMRAILFCWGDRGVCMTYLRSEISYSEKMRDGGTDMPRHQLPGSGYVVRVRVLELYGRRVKYCFFIFLR